MLFETTVSVLGASSTNGYNAFLKNIPLSTSSCGLHPSAPPGPCCIYLYFHLHCSFTLLHLQQLIPHSVHHPPSSLSYILIRLLRDCVPYCVRICACVCESGPAVVNEVNMTARQTFFFFPPSSCHLHHLLLSILRVSECRRGKGNDVKYNFSISFVRSSTAWAMVAHRKWMHRLAVCITESHHELHVLM